MSNSVVQSYQDEETNCVENKMMYETLSDQFKFANMACRTSYV